MRQLNVCLYCPFTKLCYLLFCGGDTSRYTESTCTDDLTTMFEHFCHFSNHRMFIRIRKSGEKSISDNQISFSLSKSKLSEFSSIGNRRLESISRVSFLDIFAHNS